MLLKNILKSSTNKLLLLSILVCFIFNSFSIAEELKEIVVIYPKPDQTISAVDSTFILGNIPFIDNYKLNKFSINEKEVKVHEDGGFIGYVNLTPGIFIFFLQAEYISENKYNAKDTLFLTKTVQVSVPSPVKSLPLDTLRIAVEYRPPAGDLTLTADDRLKVSIQATPGCIAWFSIPGIADSIPMSESTPHLQPYWGESVFGQGKVPDSMKIKGIYSGFYDFKNTDKVNLKKNVFYLGSPDKMNLAWQLFSSNAKKDILEILQLMQLPDTVLTYESRYNLTVNSDEYPFTVRFTDSVQIIRHRPGKGYFSIFQPEGIEALAVGAVNDWYKLKLSANQYAWAFKNSVVRLPGGILPPQSLLTAVKTSNNGNALVFEFPLSGKHPFKIIEDDRNTIRIQLFGVTSDTDWIRFNPGSEMIDFASWHQVEPDLYEFKIKLNRKIWGYDSYYKGNTFYFKLNKPPDNIKSLKDKSIVIDPGHSSDKGSVGPTGFAEKDANLAISLQLRNELLKRGADVIMTRNDDSHVSLYDRPAIAKANNADLFISIHNNALPDGVNPFINNGTSAYYYHLHSIDLARSIHDEMLKETKMNDYGLYHGNLAVNRPTQYPAVLVECAFMILPEQEAMLKTQKYQKKVAKAIRKGIEQFLKEFEDE